jgi:putative copper resistance protein D
VNWLALCRGLHVASLLSAVGSLTGTAVVARPAIAGFSGATALRRRLRLVALASLAAALLTGILWGLGSAGAIADAENLGETLAAVPLVVAQTRFGALLAVRLVLLVVALGLAARWWPIRLLQGLAVVAAIAIQPLLGHAGAMGGRAGMALTGTEMLHLLAAGAWLGGLLPLALCVAALPADRAALAAERFLPIGLASVLALAGTGFVQGAALIGRWRGLLDTAYGHLALLKIGLFVVLVGLACLNRFVLAARLRTAGGGRRALVASVALETVLGLAVVLAAAWLGSTEPSIDIPST